MLGLWGRPSSFVDVVFYVFLINGLIPFVSWLALFFASSSTAFVRLFIYLLLLLHFITLLLFLVHMGIFFIGGFNLLKWQLCDCWFV